MFAAGKSAAQGSAIDTTKYGLFGGGTTGSNTAITQKYFYPSDTVGSGTSLGTARNSLGAAGNASVGIFGGGTTGSNSLVTDVYTYAGDGRASGSSLGTARWGLAAAGNSTVGIFGGGTTGTVTTVTDKYTYSNNARGAGTALGTARWYLGAASNSTVAIFASGRINTGAASALTDRYTFSNDSRVAGSNMRAGGLNVSKHSVAGTGDATAGYYGGGFPSGQQIMTYIYSNNTTAGVASQIRSRTNPAATGNTTFGLWAGGISTSSSTIINWVDKLTYATLAVTAATNLTTAVDKPAATSSQIGNF